MINLKTSYLIFFYFLCASTFTTFCNARMGKPNQGQYVAQIRATPIMCFLRFVHLSHIVYFLHKRNTNENRGTVTDKLLM